MSNVDHAAMVDGDILLFTLPQSAYIYRKSRTAHAPSNFLEVGVRLLETGEDAAIGERNFRSRLYITILYLHLDFSLPVIMSLTIPISTICIGIIR